MLQVPGFAGNTETLRTLLARQNRHLNIKSWSLTHERSMGDSSGVQLYFRVPQTDVETLQTNNRRVYYLMGNIYVRFLDRENPTRVDAQVCVAAPEASEPGPSRPTPTPPELGEVEAIGDTVPLVPMEVATGTNTSDEECFPETGGSELSDSCLRSSPLPDN